MRKLPFFLAALLASAAPALCADSSVNSDKAISAPAKTSSPAAAPQTNSAVTNPSLSTSNREDQKPPVAPSAPAPASAPARQSSSAAVPAPVAEKKQTNVAPTAASVAPLRDLALFYEGEGANVRKMMESWNTR